MATVLRYSIDEINRLGAQYEVWMAIYPCCMDGDSWAVKISETLPSHVSDKWNSMAKNFRSWAIEQQVSTLNDLVNKVHQDYLRWFIQDTIRVKESEE